MYDDEAGSGPTAMQRFQQLPPKSRGYLMVAAAALLGIVLLAANQVTVPPGAVAKKTWFSRWLPAPWSFQQSQPLDRAGDAAVRVMERAAEKGERFLDRALDGLEKRRPGQGPLSGVPSPPASSK
jgi:hypothetical protein